MSVGISHESRKNSLLEAVSFKEQKSGNGSFVKGLNEKTSLTIDTHTRVQSKLTLARDSIILQISSAKKKSLLSLSKAVQDNLSKNSSEFKEHCQKFEKDDDENSSQKSLEEGRSRTSSKLLQATDSFDIIKSTISPLPKDGSQLRNTHLSFTTNLEVGNTTSAKVQQRAQQRKKTNYKPSKPRSIIKKKVTSTYKSERYKTNEYTEDRIKDLVNMMKESPSLIRLFTSCIK